MKTLKNFSNSFNCNLSILTNGEHYFHTDEQLEYYKEWLKKLIKYKDFKIFFDQRLINYINNDLLYDVEIDENTSINPGASYVIMYNKNGEIQWYKNIYFSI